MTDKRLEYLWSLADGHALWKEEYAQEVCKAFGVEYDPRLKRKHYADYKGMFNESGKSVPYLEAVDDNDLLEYIADKLGVEYNDRSFIGRGFRAQHTAQKIADAIKAK